METTQQVLAGVNTLLRRPSQAKLHYSDVLERMNDILKGYVQDMDLGGRDQRTATSDVELVDDGTDFILSLPNVPDFEPVRLEFGTWVNSATQEWREVMLVPFESWEKHAGKPYVAGSIYGSAGMPGGVRLKLNLDRTTLSQTSFKLSYRLPLLAVVQMGEFPPVPSNFLPMLKLETALAVMPLVQDSTPEWIEWTARTVPVYVAQLQDWKRRWEQYLSESVEPAAQPMPVFNDFRRGASRRTPRAYLPIR